MNLQPLAPRLLSPALAGAASGEADPVDPGYGPRLRVFAAGDGGQEVTVKRRRQSATGKQTAGRAEASHRPSAGGGGGTGGSAGGAGMPTGGGSSSSGGRGRMGGGMGGIVMLAILALLVWFLFFRGGGSDTATPDGNLPTVLEPVQMEQQAESVSGWGNLIPAAFDLDEPPAEPEISITMPRPAAGASVSPEGDTWTVMLYQDADDQVLEQDILIDLNEAERYGSTDKVTVVAEFDRFRGGYNGDGNWSSTKRFLVQKDNDLTRIGSREIEDLGEANLASGDQLVDFIVWAVENYPADKYALVMSDHGMGWPGGWSDPTSNERVDAMPLAQAMGKDMLWLMEIDEALGRARELTGIDKFELIGMDACLMAHLEVFTALAPHARYAVASQETEPAVGWAYTSVLEALNGNPAMNGGELGAEIVRGYIDEDQRILDDNARAGFARGSAQQVARQLGQGITLTAVDLSYMPALNEAFNGFAYQLQGVNQKAVAQARSYAQSYTSIFGRDVPPSYIDIGNFLGLVVQNSGDEAIQQAALAVAQQIENAVVAEKHGPGKPGSFGISIYFPNSQLYGSSAAGPRSYSVAAERFVNESAWDEFLAFHYTGRQFRPADRTLAVPADGFASRSPAAGAISVSEITVSDNEVAPDGAIEMSAEISGENIGYVRLMIGMFDPDSQSIHLLDTDYLEAPDTREVNGVFYPVWPVGPFTMNFVFEPIITAITDGNTQTPALLRLESYGRSAKQATYAVEGDYTFADGTSRRAQLILRDGLLRNVYTFSEEQSPGMPREVLPSQGDTFTVLEKWMGADQAIGYEQGATLTFGAGDFEWISLIAAAGDYVVGFIVEDLDGNEYPTYTQIRVLE